MIYSHSGELCRWKNEWGIYPYTTISGVYNYMKKQGRINSIWNATIYLRNNIN